MGSYFETNHKAVGTTSARTAGSSQALHNCPLFVCKVKFMNINSHRLDGDSVSFVESANHAGAFTKGLPDTLVIHFTAGASLESSVRTLCTPGSNASAHAAVGRDGRIVQLVPFNIVAWHAGASSFGGRTGLNKFSIGIEIDNAGRLTQTASGDFLTWFNKRIPKEEVVQGMHRNETRLTWWHSFTEEQIDRVSELARLLIATYPIKTVVGHEEISPRPQDRSWSGISVRPFARALARRGSQRRCARKTPARDGDGDYFRSACGQLPTPD